MSAEIARTIADQLTQSNNGYNRLKAMISGNNFYYSSANDKNLGGGLSFQFKGSRKASLCGIVLDFNDTYTMKFYRGIKEVKEISDLYAEDLMGVFSVPQTVKELRQTDLPLFS